MNWKTCIIGGETHLGEITECIGKGLDLVAVCVNPHIYQQYFSAYHIPNYENEDQLIQNHTCHLAGIANENDRKHQTIMKCLKAGMDIIADKPICITKNEQSELEEAVARYKKDVLMLLTLRGNPPYMAVRECVKTDMIGEPVHCHVRMAVRLKREQRPPWFLDSRRSGGMFLDLLIHGIDALEWITGLRIKNVIANTGNLGNKDDAFLVDHAALYCELCNGGTAVIEGQRLLPDTKGSDYRVMIAGTKGVVDMDMTKGEVLCTNQAGSGITIKTESRIGVVSSWLKKEPIVTTTESLRANRIAICAAESALFRQKVSIF